MNEQFHRAIVEVAEHLLGAASTDDRLRSSLRLCAEEVLARTTHPAPPAVDEAPSPLEDEQPVGEPAHPPKPRQADEPFNLTVMQGRLALKADAARWAAERPRRLAEGADPNLEIRPQDQEFIRRAQEQDAYLWMLDQKGRHPGTPDQFTLIAAWYENLAEALGLLDLMIAEDGCQADEMSELLELAAQSQSALRVAVGECGGSRDEDQQAVFNWLRNVAAERRIFIRVGMKWDAPTDPSEGAAVAGRIHEAGRRFEERQAQARMRKKLLAKVKHKAAVLTANTAEALESWGELMAVVDELVKAGLPASNKELREALLPVLDRLPTGLEMQQGFRLAVREIEKFRQSRPLPEATTEGPEPGAFVREARKLLRGRSLVLIGGEARRGAKEALERALGLKKLIWLKGNDYRSFQDFEPFVARPDVAVVVLAIRWSSHSFGEVRSLCDRYGKPLVRLPAGYNANQVAQQIVVQAGKRMAKQPGADS
jgi:hypothetical protein